MRFSVYETDHELSRVISRAAAEGCGGQIVPAGNFYDGTAVVYGILRGCGAVIRKCQWVRRDFYHIDLGYFGRGHFGGYYRVTRNGFQYTGNGAADPGRFERLGVEIEPWREGRHVLVCPLSRNFGEFEGIDSRAWTQTVLSEIPKYTDRPVQVKPKGEGSLKDSLKDCHLLVTYNSNAAIDALRLGVPVCVLGPSAAAPLSTPLDQIEDPVRGNRESLFARLANHQWTLDEIKEGLWI